MIPSKRSTISEREYLAKPRHRWDRIMEIFLDQLEENQEALDAEAGPLNLPENLALLVWPLKRLKPETALAEYHDRNPELDLDNLPDLDPLEVAKGILYLTMA
jgi:hypothetical protein